MLRGRCSHAAASWLLLGLCAPAAGHASCHVPLLLAGAHHEPGQEPQLHQLWHQVRYRSKKKKCATGGVCCAAHAHVCNRVHAAPMLQPLGLVLRLPSCPARSATTCPPSAAACRRDGALACRCISLNKKHANMHSTTCAAAALCRSLLTEKGHSSVVLKAMGKAINKTVTIGGCCLLEPCWHLQFYCSLN